MESDKLEKLVDYIGYSYFINNEEHGLQIDKSLRTHSFIFDSYRKNIDPNMEIIIRWVCTKCSSILYSFYFVKVPTYVLNSVYLNSYGINWTTCNEIIMKDICE